MSIFNLQSLEEKAEQKKIELENEKKRKQIARKMSAPSSENIFVTTIREINTIANTVNANLAYKESLQKEIDEDPTLFKNVISDFMQAFTDIDMNLKDKCLALKVVLNILKGRLDLLENDAQDDLIVKTDCEFTNLAFIKDSENLKMLVNEQLDMVDKETLDFEHILAFRESVRHRILGDSATENISKASYILGLYKKFRDIDINADINTVKSSYDVTLNKETLHTFIDKTYEYPIMYHHDVLTLYAYLESLYNSEDIQVNDVVTKRIEVILEEYALLYSARADAIVEFTNKVREYLSIYIETFGGNNDDDRSIE